MNRSTFALGTCAIVFICMTGVLAWDATRRRTEVPPPALTMEGVVALAQIMQQAHRLAEDLEKKRSDEVAALRGIVAAFVARSGGNVLLSENELKAARMHNIQGLPEAGGNLRLFVLGTPMNSGAADAGRRTGTATSPSPEAEVKGND